MFFSQIKLSVYSVKPSKIGRITVKQLTREVLVELVDKIYVYPEQKIDIYFKFASVESSPDRILEKDGVI